MAEGIWTGNAAGENLRQGKLTRHRILTVNVGTRTNVAWNAVDSSGLASLDPNAILPDTHNTVTDRGPEGGPHFVLSGDTPDESHCYGFEFCIFVDGLITAQRANPGVGGYTVTVWCLISNTQSNGAYTPVWAAMQPQTGVAVRTLYHSFDINAQAIRFEIDNLESDPTATSLSLQIALAEL